MTLTYLEGRVLGEGASSHPRPVLHACSRAGRHAYDVVLLAIVIVDVGVRRGRLAAYRGDHEAVFVTCMGSVEI